MFYQHTFIQQRFYGCHNRLETNHGTSRRSSKERAHQGDNGSGTALTGGKDEILAVFFFFFFF